MTKNKTYQYPGKFVWGVAAAATQVEGAAREDGKGESIWDRFCAIPGKTAGGDTPAVACDHYRRYREDIRLFRRVGFRNYRLSIAWPRIFPNGRGPVNRKGLDFYDRLMDTALQNGVTPWVTLYHWDLPQALEDGGGWRVRSTPEAFALYAAAVVKRLGDRVKNWMTLNEIPCIVGLGYGIGRHAPGARENSQIVNQCYHHTLLAHGLGVQAVREHGGKSARVGLVHNPAIPIPLTETPADIAAAQAQFREQNGHLLAPVFTGRYPAAFLRKAGMDAPSVTRGDMAVISQPTDFVGLNIYGGSFVRAVNRTKREVLPLPDDYPRGTLSWLNVTPQVAYWSVRHVSDVFGADDIYITENGVCYNDTPDKDGDFPDLGRREFMRNYLIQLHRAIADGYKVRGYFAWSVMDNFEWAEGYEKRFGLIHVDYKSQRRTPKASAVWYSRVSRENRVL